MAGCWQACRVRAPESHLTFACVTDWTRMRNALQVTAGERFGRLIVIDPEVRIPMPPSSGRTSARGVICLCDCGKEVRIKIATLLRGQQSCGCLAAEQSRIRATKHRMNQHPLHKTWKSIKSRCYSKLDTSYRFYGDVGVGIFEEWRDDSAPFIEWIESNLGDKPEGWTLDRIDGSRDYEPGNLRWADPKTQSRNRKSTRLNEDAVRFIRSAYPDQSIADLARAFSVTHACVWHVVMGNTWKGVT